MSIFHGSRERSFIIKAPTSSAWPRHLGALHVRSAYEPAAQEGDGPARASVTFGRLLEWQLHLWQRMGNVHAGGHWFDDDRAQSFWSTVRTWAKRVGTLCLFGWRIWPAWCLLDGVREVNEGRLILDLAPREDEGALPGARPRRASGLFVAEDPPTIICLACPGGGRIKILDLSNYGIEPENYGVKGNAGALAAATTAVKDYHRLGQVADLGSLQTTGASQAWYCFRRSHMHHPIVVHPLEKVLALEQAAYYGGRCECAVIGPVKKKLYHLDVNSMYTSLGLMMPFPVRHVGTSVEDGENFLPMGDRSLLRIADVTLGTDHPCVPWRENRDDNPYAVPARRPGRERIIYPVGEFRTALAGPELELTERLGHVRRYHRVQYYEGAPLMHEWSKWALSIKERLPDMLLGHLKGAFKKLMNSLPGKFGQRVKRWMPFAEGGVIHPQEEMASEWSQEWGQHPEHGGLTPFRTIAGATQYQDNEELSSFACPAIAAFWTSYGRVFLWAAFEHVGLFRVYYCDTDSIVVDEDGYRLMVAAGFVDQARPGAWKLKEESDNVVFLGIRRYRFGPRWCVAGPHGSEISGSGEPGHFQGDEGFASQMWARRACEPAKIERIVRWRKDYRHGSVDSEGVVVPWRIGGGLPRGPSTL